MLAHEIGVLGAPTTIPRVIESAGTEADKHYIYTV
jgi:hypothetical protein